MFGGRRPLLPPPSGSHEQDGRNLDSKTRNFLLGFSLLDELQELKWGHVGKLNFLRFFLRFSKIGLNALFSHSTGNALS